MKNNEIIIVIESSTNNSEKILEYLLKSNTRIRIFKHLKNLWSLRTKIDSWLYSNVKNVILFDFWDSYYDNYVLEDLCDLKEKFNFKLVSIKLIFRIIKSYNYNK